MTRTAEATARAAEADSTNVPGTCLMQCRQWADIPALYPDAATAWKNVNDKHLDRNPPRGSAVYWTGGSHGFGHIAISLGEGRIRSTDAGGSGKVDTVDLSWVENNWHLTYAGWGEDINEHHIPGTERKPVLPKPPRGTLVRATHASMQFSDTPAQKHEDADRIFARSATRHVWWITGTEGFEADARAALASAAKKHGYRLWVAPGQDAWIAVKADVIVGEMQTFAGPVIVPGVEGEHTAKKVVSVTFHTDRLGWITVIACHLLTKGRPVTVAEFNQHLKQNRAITKAIGEHARKMGRGLRLSFYGGDQNINDKTDDTFLGAPLTSLADELDAHQNTGHGPIDVIASYDRDGRVEGESWKVLDDKEFALHTDHFLVEGAFRIKELKR